ncbi:mycothiol transferase [Catenulispora subtropica]|uniref:DUF664 domain-containing protein n=1 Tax=Catenulispora subtropica TaxID=450798 RepID=A0ABP5ERU9_9ACTN
MQGHELLIDAFGRVHEEVHAAVAGLTVEQLHQRLDPDANPIAWLLWHLARVQDDHVADVAGTEQLWTVQGWAERFGTPYRTGAIGYGHSSHDVAQLRVPSADLLTGYHDAVHEQTVAYVSGLKDEDFDRIVDTRWDPPVTLGVRLVSVVSDTLQHVGQAAYVRGVLLRES